MSGLRITRTPSDCSHMRSQIAHAGNNTNTLSKFSLNEEMLLMLFYRSDTNIREFIVIYVLN
jgi:hypothetical protein